MLTRWTDLWPDIDRTVAAMDEFQRRMNQLFKGYEGHETYRRPGLAATPRGSWPPVNLYDAGEELVLHALVPGVTEKDLTITAHQDVLTLSGERQSTAPEGYSVHRQERGGIRFSRSFTLPCACDLEKVSATVKDGVLTVRLAKAAEAKPRQITVTAK
jgi:HSP20 family protein